MISSDFIKKTRFPILPKLPDHEMSSHMLEQLAADLRDWKSGDLGPAEEMASLVYWKYMQPELNRMQYQANFQQAIQPQHISIAVDDSKKTNRSKIFRFWFTVVLAIVIIIGILSPVFKHGTSLLGAGLLAPLEAIQGMATSPSQSNTVPEPETVPK